MSQATKILCVDDQPVIRRLLERIFKSRSEEVVLAGSADEAIEILESDRFQLVITDIRMPGGGGTAVARAAQGVSVPVIFITGYAETGDVQEFLDKGVPIVRKPFTPRQLLEVVGEMLEPSGGDGDGRDPS